MDKKFCTTNSQLRKLRSKGLLIKNGSRAKKILEKENYYKLINGYKELFIDNSYTGNDEKYKQNTDFNEIYQLYLFDRELRNIFMKYILEIENNIKSTIAYDFSKKYGHDNYLKVCNFDTIINKNQKNKTSSEKIAEIIDLISHLERELSTQLKKKDKMISHYVSIYGYVPLWVLINKLSLGTVSKFYTYLKDKDKNDVGRKFNLKSKELKQFLFMLSIYRNACAHDERFYNLKVSKAGIENNIIHNKLNIPRNDFNEYMYGKKDLFSIVIIFKIMLDKKTFNNFFTSIKKLFESLEKYIKTITIEEVQQKMGFPNNWYDIKSIQGI